MDIGDSGFVVLHSAPAYATADMELFLGTGPFRLKLGAAIRVGTLVLLVSLFSRSWLVAVLSGGHAPGARGLLMVFGQGLVTSFHWLSLGWLHSYKILHRKGVTFTKPQALCQNGLGGCVLKASLVFQRR